MPSRLARHFALFVVLWPAPARADDACYPPSRLSTCIPADNLWPSAAGTFTWLAPATTVRPGSIAFGLLASYSYRPIGLHVASADPEGTTVYAVAHALGAHLLASAGVNSRLAFDIDAPFTLYQVGAGTAFLSGSEEQLPRSAVGDFRFGPTVSLWKDGGRGIDLAARFHIAAPTGNRNAFTSSPSATFAPGVSFAYTLRRLRLGADAGARMRRFVELGSAAIGNQLSLGLGASYDVVPASWLTIGTELAWLFTLEQQATQFSDPDAGAAREEPSSRPHIPAEWLITFRTARLLQGRFRATLGIGGLFPTGPTTAVTAPLLRAIASVGLIP